MTDKSLKPACRREVRRGNAKVIVLLRLLIQISNTDIEDLESATCKEIFIRTALVESKHYHR